MQGETQRQIEHVTPVAFALLLRWIPLWLAVLLAALSVVYGGVVSPRLFHRTLRGDEAARGYSTGKILYGLSVLVLLLVFGLTCGEGKFYVVAGAWALLGVGDAAANFVGRSWGRAKVPWNREKSWAGLAGFIVFGTLAAGLLIWWVSGGKNHPPLALVESMLLALGAAAAAGVVETLRVPHVNDNVSVPATGALVIYLMTL